MLRTTYLAPEHNPLETTIQLVCKWLARIKRFSSALHIVRLVLLQQKKRWCGGAKPILFMQALQPDMVRGYLAFASLMLHFYSLVRTMIACNSVTVSCFIARDKTIIGL